MALKTKLYLLLVLILSSCGNSIEFKEERPSAFQGNVPLEELNFKNISQKIIAPKCLSCHPGYSDYTTVFDKKDSMLSNILSNRMPKNSSPLEDDLKALFATWVQNGAPIGADANQDTTILKLEPNWESLSKLVFFAKCVSCHNPSGQASFLDLSNRQSFFDNRVTLLNNFEDPSQSYLIEVINDDLEPMPPTTSGFERLSLEEVKAIEKWIELGLP